MGEKVVIVGETRPGSSMALVAQQVATRLLSQGYEIELVDVYDKGLMKAIHQQKVVVLAQIFFTFWLKSERFCHPRSIISVFCANWQEYDLNWQLFYLSFLLKAQHAGVPVLHVSHSHETTRALRATAMKWFQPSVVAGLLGQVKTVLYGVEEGFEYGVNDRDHQVAPFNRVNTSLKNTALHAELHRQIIPAMRLAGGDPKVHFYKMPSLADDAIKPYEDVYTFTTQPESRDEYRANASKTGLFVSTSRTESFGIYFIELLLAGAVGLFQKQPWCELLLPGYPFMGTPAELPDMALWAYKNHDEAKATLREKIVPWVRETYRIDRFTIELAQLIDLSFAEG